MKELIINMEKIVNMSQLEDRKKSKPQNIGYKSVKWIVFVIRMRSNLLLSEIEMY